MSVADRPNPPPAPAPSVRVEPRVFYGWWVVLVTSLAMLIHSGAGYYAFGLFYKPLETQFGWTRGAISAAMTIVLVLGGILGPLYGWWADRRGARWVIAGGSLLMGLCLVGAYFIDALWQLYLVYAIMAFGRAANSAIPGATVVGRWFAAKRGLALGLVTAGLGAGGLIVVPIASAFIEWWGWRAAFLGLGLLTWLIIVPQALVTRNSPAERGLLRYGAQPGLDDGATAHGEPSRRPGDRSWSLAQLAGTANFWLVTLSGGLAFFGVGGVLMHTVPLLIDRGMPSATAAAVLSFVAGAGTLGKLGLGALADRVPAKRVLALSFILQVAGVAVLLVAGTSWAVWVFAAVYGFGMGGVITVRTVLVSECFGVVSFGLALGASEMFGMIANALGPVFAGWVYDTLGTYVLALVVYAVVYTLGIGTVLLVNPAGTAAGEAPSRLGRESLA